MPIYALNDIVFILEADVKCCTFSLQSPLGFSVGRIVSIREGTGETDPARYNVEIADSCHADYKKGDVYWGLVEKRMQPFSLAATVTAVALIPLASALATA